MKWIFISRIPRWYIIFTFSFFIVVALMSIIPKLNFIVNEKKLTPIFQGNLSKPKVAFACNVFWGEEFLPSMLNTFAASDIKITFFIGGSWAKRYPDHLRDIANRGHELGNHTYSHPHPNIINKSSNQEQILKTEELVRNLTGIKTNLYAPPYGEYNNTVLSAATELGYSTIMWSIDTVDWKRPSPEVIKNRVLNKLHNGAIILMHPTEPTAKALPELIEQIRGRGYEISTVSDVLN